MRIWSWMMFNMRTMSSHGSKCIVHRHQCQKLNGFYTKTDKTSLFHCSRLMFLCTFWVVLIHGFGLGANLTSRRWNVFKPEIWNIMEYVIRSGWSYPTAQSGIRKLDSRVKHRVSSNNKCFRPVRPSLNSIDSENIIMFLVCSESRVQVKDDNVRSTTTNQNIITTNCLLYSLELIIHG